MRNTVKKAFSKLFRAAGFNIIRQESFDQLLAGLSALDELRQILLTQRRTTAAGTPDPFFLDKNVDSALSKLDGLAKQYICAAETSRAENVGQLRSLAEHYRASAEALALESIFCGKPVIRKSFSDDDGTLDYAKRQNIYYPTPGGEATIEAGRPHFPWAHLFNDPECGIFLVIGQSNAANHGGGSHRARPGVYSLNFFDLRCYAADDPLPGASGNGASPWPILGDLLIERSLFKRVLFVPVAFAGTYAIDWTKDGPIQHRLTLALTRLQKRLGVHMIGFDGVFWQQGEAEANLTDLAASQYRAQLEALFEGLRQYGVYCPIFVSRTSICEGPAPHPFKNHAAIRQAQEEVVDLSRGIVAGPDTDRISGAGRSDGCHFSAEGIRQAASLWLESIEGSRQFLGKGLPPTLD
jgi:carbohydrate esterase-like sialic acid-specific acetylesterase